MLIKGEQDPSRRGTDPLLSAQRLSDIRQKALQRGTTKLFDPEVTNKSKQLIEDL